MLISILGFIDTYSYLDPNCNLRSSSSSGYSSKKNMPGVILSEPGRNAVANYVKGIIFKLSTQGAYEVINSGVRKFSSKLH